MLLYDYKMIEVRIFVKKNHQFIAWGAVTGRSEYSMEEAPV